MAIYNVFTNELDSIPNGRADFILAGNGSTFSKLDAEFLEHEKVFSSDTIIQEEGTLPFVLISRAVHNLYPFSAIKTLKCEQDVDAKEAFKKGMNFGREYELKGNYLILAFSIEEDGAVACIDALGYGSSVDESLNNFEKLSAVNESVLLFYAGFMLEASRRFHIVLGGGLEIAACLLIADKLKEDVLMRIKSDNITVATSKWMLQGSDSKMKNLLSLLSYTPHAIYAEFSLENAEIPMLKCYGEGKVKDNSGAGVALAYAMQNDFSNREILDALELLVYMM